MAVVAQPAAATPLTVAKTVEDQNGGDVNPGDVLRFTIVVTNPSGPAAPNTVVTDPVPASLSYVPESITLNGSPRTDASDGDGAGLVAGTPTFVVGTMNAGAATATMTFDVQVDADVVDGTQIVNTATASYGGASDAGSVTVKVVVPPPAVTIGKTVQDVNGGAVQPGDTLRYTVTASNASTAAPQATITDALPAGVTYVAGTLTADAATLSDAADADAGHVSGGTVTVAAGAGNVLAKGATRTVTFDARVDGDVLDGTLIVNTGSIAYTFGGATSTITSPAASVTVSAPPALTVQKQVSDLSAGAVMRGDELRYTITVTSTGVGYARDVVVTDPIPASTAYVAGSTSIDGAAMTDATADDGVDAGQAGITARLGTLAPGATRTLTFRVRVSDSATGGAAIANTATAVFGGLAGGATSSVTSAPAVVTVTVIPPPNIVVTETYQLVFDADNDGRIGPGDLLQYTVVVANRGAGPATGVTQTMQIPAVVEFIPRSLITTRGTATFSAPGTIVAQVGSLGAGESASIAWVVRLGANATSLDQLVNSSSVSAGTGTAPGSGAGAQPLASGPRLRVTVRGPRQLRGGEVATFRIVVRNMSGRDVRNLAVSDLVPGGLSAVAGAPRFRLVRGTPTWRVAIVRAGSSVTIVLRLRATRTARGARTNSVVLSGATVPTVTLHTPLRILPAARTPRPPVVLG